MLRALMRVNDKITVFAESKSFASALAKSGLMPYFELRSYKDYAGSAAVEKTVALLDAPPCSLRELVNYCKRAGAEQVLLLFNEKEARQQLALTHPDREAMATAYKLVMHVLQLQTEVDCTRLISENSTQISENAVKIMEQLGFISYNNGIIKKGVIKRCSLEDAPLYVALQQERAGLERSYQENFKLSQHDLLRG